MDFTSHKKLFNKFTKKLKDILYLSAKSIVKRIIHSKEKLKMKIKVKLFTSLREITGEKMVEIDSPSKTTIKELLVIISKKFGARVEEYLFTEKAEVRRYIQVLVNGRTKKLDTYLVEGDTIALLPPVGGG